MHALTPNGIPSHARTRVYFPTLAPAPQLSPPHWAAAVLRPRPLPVRHRPAPRGPRAELPPRRRVLQARAAGFTTKPAPNGRRRLIQAQTGLQQHPAQHIHNYPTLVPLSRMADAIVINKANTAPPGAVDKIREAAARINPSAAVRACLAHASLHARCALVQVGGCVWDETWLLVLPSPCRFM